MNYYDFTSKIFGFPTSRWEDKVTATKIRGSSTLTKTLLRGYSKSGLIVLISIVFYVCFTGIFMTSVCNYIFNYLLQNMLVYFQNVWLFLYLGNLCGRIT